jgi:hypothetical protein
MPPAPFEIHYRPIKAWKGDAKVPDPQPKAWSVQLPKTHQLLTVELQKLGSDPDCLIETDHQPREIGIAGVPRADAAARRVQLWFRVKGKDKVLPSQAYRTWLENLHAIALTLQRQRLVRDYGVVTVAQQLRTYDALPAGAGGGFASAEDAAAWIIEKAGEPPLATTIEQCVRGTEALRRLYRTAATKCHPDKPGGSQQLMARLEEAKTLIEAAR